MGKYIIYLRRNKVNGMQYVGQTIDFKGREGDWRCLRKRHANNHIDKDRTKYGLDNWTVDILGEADNREDAWELEQRFIRDFNTIWPNGYNLAKGGSGNNGYKHSEKTRQKIAESHKGKHHSDETRQKMSDVKKGKSYSDETRQKISEAKKGKYNTKLSKQVYQYTLDGVLKKVWPSTAECGRNGYNCGCISECCNGERKTHNGFKWSYILL